MKGGAKAHDKPSPEMTRPDMVLASSAGIATTAAENTHLASGQDHAVTAGRDMSVSLGRSLFASVGGAISMFAYHLGIKLIAAKGRVDVQAQSDQMALAALKDITISSTDGKVVITASKEVWIGAGGSYIQINGSGIVNGSPGPILEKGASWDVPGPSSVSGILPVLSTGYDQQIRIKREDGNPLANVPYFIKDEAGNTYRGLTDQDGCCERVYTMGAQKLTVLTGVLALEQW
ncbi:DUF2345 domain-containing protein [Caballeronia sp. LZ016]|uniref:DUF2345 domain-containing protein n=1 Tax=Caballeronia sp. LZ016 TaxID=3038554 RepID=UPI002865B61D|nr:DUF2345 domain-containing protein [Caballeronia sp. LZ016]MDR5740355.1 DUF2345 domain-containing protein [Caballeronia sp. LZ016]